ncbi:shikimate kinase [Cytobacillus purgationiresistens]|uniref:Shikimate kinase n=1 Tax=Cytobacillus purgationiresistens TaxID=863449 RepID=A0ABU0ADH1_9BACI|nr:shikimate kinase [Cytobacillus purgationiresistens]MDQ0268488.1 shikimate kinase [Cytobacillus purgationiresistens]
MGRHLEQSIVLIGFMGVGKTSVGKSLAEKLNWKFIDTDEEIEKELNLPATEIFRTFGEKVFRAKEKEVIERISHEKNKVISVGGGAFLQKEVRAICLENCTVVLLDLSWDHWLDRLPLIIETRPVLHNRSLDDIQQLYEERKSTYNYHHVKVDIDERSIEEAVDQIMNDLTAAN